jgi:hypothetical protein
VARPRPLVAHTVGAGGTRRSSSNAEMHFLFLPMLVDVIIVGINHAMCGRGVSVRACVACVSCLSRTLRVCAPFAFESI